MYRQESQIKRQKIQYDKAQKNVNETYNFYRSLLQEGKQSVLKQLDSAYNAKQLAISATAQRMQKAIEKLYQGCEFIDKIHKHASNTEIMMFTKRLHSRLDDIMSYGFDVEFVSK